ncbi:MAG: glycerol dehydrogenase [Lentisphaerae bacterium GWF2_44_16]|nr:MAG: glycerol dehydrogenase [Lentisphaerae bacterium GWF2_44_16]
MLYTSNFPGRYVQGQNILSRLPEETRKMGRKTFIVAGGTAAKMIIPQVLREWQGKLDAKVENFNGECSDEEIKRLIGKAKSSKCDFVTGIGGGKCLDAAKCVGSALKVPVAIIPTIASTDAPCSAISIIYSPGGCFKRIEYHGRNPNLVMVDSSVICMAPVRFLVSGMGDALSTWFEAQSCQRSCAQNECGGHGLITAFKLSELCYNTLLEYGKLAKDACELKIVTPALEKIIEANTLLSGLGFESAGLASAHSIHNGLTRIKGTHCMYHGEKVAFGTLAGLFLSGHPEKVLDEVYSFCEKVGLPTTFSGIGLKKVSRKELMDAAEGACAEIESIHHEPFSVTKETVLAAMIAADAYGKNRI